MNPPLCAALFALVLIVVVGAGGFIFFRSKNLDNKSDLLVDEFNRKFIVQKASNREDVTTLSWTDIVSVNVDQIQRRHSDEVEYNYALTLILTDRDRPTRKLQLAELWDQTSAENAAQWLRDMLESGSLPNRCPI